MCKKVFVLLVAILAIAGVVQAAPPPPWSVTTTVSPGLKANVAVADIGVNLPQATYKKITFTNVTTAYYTLTRVPGYKFTKIVRNGTSQVIADPLAPFSTGFKLSATPTKSQTLAATLAVQTFQITATNPTTPVNGVNVVTATFSPVKKTVNYGTNNVIKVTPAAGCEIVSLTDNGAPITAFLDSTGTTPANEAGGDLPSIKPLYIVLNKVTGDHNLNVVARPTTGGVYSVITPSLDQTKPNSFITSNGKINFSATSSSPTSKFANYEWVPTSAGATLVPATGNKTAVFTAQVPGDYLVKLKVYIGTPGDPANYREDFSSVVVHVLSSGTTKLVCANCHNSAVTSTPGSPAILTAFDASSHKAIQQLTCATCHSDHNTITFSATPSCSSCHVSQTSNVAGSAHGTKAVPALVCQSCHNSHNNSDTAKSSDTACQACHMSATPALTFANHYGCSDCHTTHTLTYKGDGLGDCEGCHNSKTHVIVSNFSKSSHATTTVPGYSPFTCVMCHSPHNSAQAFGVGTTTGCQNCHAVGSPYGIYSTSTGRFSAKAPHGQGVTAPAAGAVNVGDSIPQYLTNGAICSDCHGHDNTINAGFAEGGHGKVSSDPLNAWAHYNWSTRLNNGTRQNGNCDRCHTAVGFIKLLGQDPDMQTRLALTATAPNNVLICIGCHKSTEGELRLDAVPAGNGQALSAGYFALFSSSTASITAGNTKIQIAFPGFKNSSICIPCHSGRSTDQVFIQTIAKSNTATAVNKNYSTISTSFYQHAANMAQTFVGTGGYDFTGSLAKIGPSAHNSVNMVGSEQGPCVGCHYSTLTKTNINNATHSLEVNASSPTCNTASCHSGAPDVASAKATFYASVSVLSTLAHEKLDPLCATTNPLEMERQPVRFGRFGKLPGDPADAATATKAYGAWYNWQILATYDPAAYTHNPNYARQLLADTGNYLMNPAGTFGGPTFNDYITAQAALGNPDAIIAQVYMSSNTCITCHSDDKFVVATKNWNNSSHKTGDVYCATCHNPMTQVPTYGAGTVDGCQACHTPGQSYGIYNADLTGKAPHFPTTANSWDVGALASYTNIGTTCDNCHGHNNAINAGWAEGGHGDVTAAPWRGDSGHTDWGVQGPAVNGVNFQSSPQQTNCIRCHTSNGFAAFVDSGFTMIDRKPTGGLNAPLTCNGCHTSPEGGLRLQNFTTASHGAKGYKALWGYSTAKISGQKVVTAIQLGDNKNSNICMPCHSQRASGQEIKDVFATGTYKQYSAGSAIYPHEAQPAAIFYGKGGYEFTTSTNPASGTAPFDYQDRARHQRIGNYGTGTGYNNTGVTQGACVGCHMTSDKSHNLEVLSKDAVTGAYTKIVSTECALCHASEFTYQNVQAAKDDFNAAVKALGNVLVAKGLTLDGINPLPERTAKDLSGGTKSNTAVDANNLTAQGKMGAWFNWYLFKTADPGAFAHNPSYARRLVMDSIDYLDDGVLNSSAAATIFAQDVSVLSAAEQSGAIKFNSDPGCLGCHFGSGVNSNLAPGIEKAPHYAQGIPTTDTNGLYNAQWVSSRAQCNNCHGYGHGTDSPNGPNVAGTVNKDWAENHGKADAPAFADENFAGASNCNICHSATGFIKFVTAANPSSASNAGWKTPAVGSLDATRETIACNACHSSTAWNTGPNHAVRTLNSYSAGMGGMGNQAKYKVNYDRVVNGVNVVQTRSGVCIVCHAGRENNQSIYGGGLLGSAATNFSNTSFKGSHYLPSAGVFYAKSGFKYYTSSAKYTANQRHVNIGMNNYSSVGYLSTANLTDPAYLPYVGTGTTAGSRRVSYSANTGDGGPCAACHMGPAGHTLSPQNMISAMPASVAPSLVIPAGATGCYGCHRTDDTKTLIEEVKGEQSAALEYIRLLLESKGVYYNGSDNPYFVNTPGASPAVDPIKNWNGLAAFANNSGARLMGAAHNFKLVTSDAGAYVHNHGFVAKLLFDTVDFLQNGSTFGTAILDSTNTVFANFSAAAPGNASKARNLLTDGKGTSVINGTPKKRP